MKATRKGGVFLRADEGGGGRRCDLKKGKNRVFFPGVMALIGPLDAHTKAPSLAWAADTVQGDAAVIRRWAAESIREQGRETNAIEILSAASFGIFDLKMLSCTKVAALPLLSRKFVVGSRAISSIRQRIIEE